MISKDQQFEFLNAIFPILARQDADLLISLHPKSRRRDYEPIVTQFGAEILDCPLSEVLAAADIFVAGAYSSTVRWAMALDIPTVNLDVWGLNDSTYWGLGGFPTMTSLPDFARWYADAVSDPKSAPAVCEGTFEMITAAGFASRFAALLADRIGKSARAA